MIDTIAAPSDAMHLHSTGNPLLRLEAVNRSFGSVVALDGVSLDVKRGEVFGIIGRSGAGKSTLLRTVNGLERIDGGRVLVDGHDVPSLEPGDLNALRRRIGMIFQNFNLLSMKTVFENVELPLKLAGRDRRDREAAVWRLLDLVGLRDKAAVHPANLSGGQKQRVGIARALAGEPDLLLSDEATSALDPETTLSLLRLLKELQSTLGLTIVLITHEMSVIREICDRVAVLDRGRIIEQGPVWQVFAHPQTELTRRLLRTARPSLPEELRQRLRANPCEGGRTLVRVASSAADRFEGVMALFTEDRAWQSQIVHAEVDRIDGHPVGSVTFSIRTLSDAPLNGLLAALNAQDGEAEVLGHDCG